MVLHQEELWSTEAHDPHGNQTQTQHPGSFEHLPDATRGLQVILHIYKQSLKTNYAHAAETALRMVQFVLLFSIQIRLQYHPAAVLICQASKQLYLKLAWRYLHSTQSSAQTMVQARLNSKTCPVPLLAWNDNLPF